jgi:hypothetical protein
MNANELAEIQAFKTEELTMWERNHTATMLRQQQAEIEALKKEKWLTEIDAKQQALKQVIDMLVLHHDTLACSSYPMSKENRK